MKNIVLFSLLLTISLVAKGQQTESRLLRFPSINGDKVVFSYAGDLYLTTRQGGTARKITSHAGNEIFPRFSPDGQKIAFTGQYDGNTEVLVIPATGGEPKRLTVTATLGRDELAERMGPNNIVMTWTRDSKEVIFRSRMHSFNAFKGSLYKVSAEGGMSKQLPLAYAGFCGYSPDGKKLAFNKIFREFRTWKYYKGGMADDLWVYDTDKNSVERIVENVAQDIMPMWHGNKIFFISDRERTMNIYSVDLTTKVVTKVTDFKEFDVKFPSIGGDDIIFENGGWLYVYNIPTGKQEKLSILIQDDQIQGRDKLVDASLNIENVSMSNDGARIAICARGDVFTVPAVSGITRNLTRTSGEHDRNAIWSPDGKSIAFISDRTGEDEIYVQPADGSAPVTQLTKNADTYKYQLVWSPDGKNILWADKKLRLQYVNIESKSVTQAALGGAEEFNQYVWSPDSRYIAFTKEFTHTKAQVLVFDTQNKKEQAVTDNWYESGSPYFSTDGKYLYFVSLRDFNPIYSATEWNHAYADMAKVYVAILSKDTPSPMAPRVDEVNAAPKSTEKPATVTVTIDWEGLGNRILSLPIEVSSYFAISDAGDKVYYIRHGQADTKNMLMVYDYKKKKEAKIGEFNGYQISADRKKMLIVNEKNYYVLDNLPDDKIELKEKADLSGMKVMVNRSQEWVGIYNECWRQMRDFFYDPGMHGVNWEAMKKKYEPLLPFVQSRADLTYVIGELIAELSAGHAYIGDGDLAKPERIQLGLLGADLEAENGFVKVKKILEGENWSKEIRSPLQEPGVDVKVGDYIVAVNGVPVNEVTDFNQLMIGKAGKLTELMINSKASLDGARKVIVTPIEDEAALYYYNWVEENTRKVSEATNGRVGYIHIPDMGVKGLNEFMKHFYPQLNKEALIIDVRGNGGGNVSPMIIERLRRELDMVNLTRNTNPSSNPFEMVLGPKVTLIDPHTVSDGDLFAYRFRKNNLGKLVGQRSWGGVVGIRGSLPLLDGGTLQRPEYGKYAADGKEWVIEGTGVYPDIEVINDPYKEFMGEDQQLNKGIEVILEELKTKGQKLPDPPPFPDKSK
jgi:tricorn protease